MVREDGKWNFALVEGDGTESSVFAGDVPRQAALKAARRLEAATSEAAAEEATQELRLRERGTDTVHVYEAWAWETDAPEDGPEWLSGQITEANVSKQGVEEAGD